MLTDGRFTEGRDFLQRAGEHAAVLNLLQPSANAAPTSRRLTRQVQAVSSHLRRPAA